MTRKKDGIQAMPPFFFISRPAAETLCVLSGVFRQKDTIPVKKPQCISKIILRPGILLQILLPF